jgi:hypothetical protein
MQLAKLAIPLDNQIPKHPIPTLTEKVYRQITSGIRVLPNFLIIGAQKAGTSSLYSYLIQHPGIIPAACKEVHFFDKSDNRAQGEFWYRSHFCTQLEKHQLKTEIGYSPLTGEATPALLFSYHAPKFVSRLIPNVKIIALLRDPVDRAFSHYNHNRRRKELEPLSFQDAVQQESERIGNDLERLSKHRPCDEEKIKRYSYVHRGFYDEQLERWLKYFPREQLCILESEEFLEHSQSQLEVVLKFLGLPNHQFDVSTMFHVGEYDRQIPAETEEKLTELFRSHNQNLYRLIGREFNWRK